MGDDAARREHHTKRAERHHFVCERREVGWLAMDEVSAETPRHKKLLGEDAGGGA